MDTFNPQSMDAKVSEILTRINAIEEKGDNRQNVFYAIREQVMKTNGRVTALEATAETNRWWLGFLTGALLVLASFFALHH